MPYGIELLKGLGHQGAEGAMAGAMGMIFGGIQDRRQLKQQRKLQELQMEGNRSMMDYNMQKQMEMWHATSYKPQMEELKKAGLNPGLIYGMGGGGGQSIGGGGGGVTGSTATQAAGGEIGMAMQMGMMGAQKRLLEAQAANLEADTQNKPKVGANTEQDTLLKKANTAIAEVEGEVKNRSKEEAIMGLQAIGRKLFDEAREANVRANTTEALQEEYEESVKAQLLTAALQNEQIKAQTGLTKEQTRKVAEDIMQGWYHVRTEWNNAITSRKNAIVNEFVNDISNKHKLAVETAKGIVQAILIGLGRK